MKKIKNIIIGTLIILFPIFASAIAETISRIITMEDIMNVIYILIPVSIGILIKLERG